MPKPKRFLVILSLLLILAACSSPAPTQTPTSAPIEDEPPTGTGVITLGDISDDPGEVFDGMQPLADYLASQLGDYVAKGEVRVVATADEMIEMLKTGEVDLYFDSVYPATLIGDASGAEPILRRWRNGVAEYRTIIFTTKDSGITSLDDLPGKMVAMDNRFSTSGYAMPANYLLENGFKLALKETYEEPVETDEIGVVFSYDDENTFQWVVSGFVAAGATDDYHFGVYSENFGDQLVVLAETRPVPRQVVMINADMDPELVDLIMQVLLKTHESEEGRAALEAFDDTALFDEFPEGITTAQEQMRLMIERLETIPLPDWASGEN